ncbi:hypothetical protein FKM82_020733 [Ascaphus truei]
MFYLRFPGRLVPTPPVGRVRGQFGPKRIHPRISILCQLWVSPSLPTYFQCCFWGTGSRRTDFRSPRHLVQGTIVSPQGCRYC